MTVVARKVALVILAGPIKFWWDDNWDTPAHWHYDKWRETLSAALVQAGIYLVYRPHHAFKGAWTERGQVVNDAVLKAADVFMDMTPPGVPSEGTDSEREQASANGAIIVPAPPPATEDAFDDAIVELLKQLEALGVHRQIVEQVKVIECIGWAEGRTWLFESLINHYHGHVFRLHFQDASGRLAVEDAQWACVDTTSEWLSFRSLAGVGSFDLHCLYKVEVLADRV